MGLRHSAPATSEDVTPPQPSYWQMIRMGYQEVVSAIIRPPRAEYSLTHLGPPTFEFCGRAFQRNDFVVVNERGLRVQCSQWEPVEYPLEKDEGHGGAGKEGTSGQARAQRGPLPCVVYMHGNSSARVEALPQLSLCLSLGITLVALDFAGSGRSDGEFVSLGYYEKDDLKAVVEHLRRSGRVSRIVLWGRSMGAVTALMHGERDPSLAAMILDSPFADFLQLADEVVEKGREHGVHVPRLVTRLALRFIKSSVQSKANFNIHSLAPIAQAPACYMPALFVAGRDDDFIDPSHARRLHHAYGGDKNILIVEGDHNSMRPRFLYDSISIFLQQTLELEEELILPGASTWISFPPWAQVVVDGDAVYCDEEGEDSEEGGYGSDRGRTSNRWEEGFVFDELGHVPAPIRARGGGGLVREDGMLLESSSMQQLPTGMTQARQREIQHAVHNLLGGSRDGERRCKSEKRGGVGQSSEPKPSGTGIEEWSCALCTLINDCELSHCDACGAVRPRPGGSPPSRTGEIRSVSPCPLPASPSMPSLMTAQPERNGVMTEHLNGGTTATHTNDCTVEKDVL